MWIIDYFLCCDNCMKDLGSGISKKEVRNDAKTEGAIRRDGKDLCKECAEIEKVKE